MEKNTGKVREFFQSRKVGTMVVWTCVLQRKGQGHCGVKNIKVKAKPVVDLF